MKDSHILLIGGTGFIGKCLEKTLKKHEYTHVKSVSRSTHGVDVTDPSTLGAHIGKADIVVNLAGFVSFFRKDRKKVLQINDEGARNVLRVCEENGVKRLIHISSTASFGFGHKEADEETKFNWDKYKFLHYSYSKYLPDGVIHESKLHTNIVYPPLVVGPHSNENMQRIFDYAKGKKLIFAPGGRNAYVDVRDLCEGIVLVLEKAKSKHNYILAGGNVTFVEMIKAICGVLEQKSWTVRIPKFLEKPAAFLARALEFVGLKIPAENIFLSFKSRRFSTEKAVSELGFEPKHDLSESFDYMKRN